MISTKFKPGDSVYYYYDKRNTDEGNKRHGTVVVPHESDIYDIRKEIRVYALWRRNGDETYGWMEEPNVYFNACKEQDHEYIPIEACGFNYMICKRCRQEKGNDQY